MSIKEVLNQGEFLNEEQQENVAGGMEANINDVKAKIEQALETAKQE